MNSLFSRTALKAICILLIAPLLLLGCGVDQAEVTLVRMRTGSFTS
jgi:hypothetical protein